MVAANTLRGLRERYPVEDWDLIAADLLRAGFEIAVDGAELCHESECTHDNAESHLNWTEARRLLEGVCADLLAGHASEAT